MIVSSIKQTSVLTLNVTHMVYTIFFSFLHWRGIFCKHTTVHIFSLIIRCAICVCELFGFEIVLNIIVRWKEVDKKLYVPQRKYHHLSRFRKGNALLSKETYLGKRFALHNRWIKGLFSIDDMRKIISWWFINRLGIPSNKLLYYGI